MDKKAVLENIKTFVYQAMSQNDPAHDTEHIRRTVNLAKHLAERYPQADAFLVEILALLHDISDDKLKSNLGKSAVADFLYSQGFSQKDVDFLLQGIDCISFRKCPRLPEDTPLEICIVQDADRIDAMGAVGVARTFAYGGAKGRPLHQSLAHFEEKLLKLYDLLSTEAGRELAKPRKEFLLSFYRQFQEEVQ